MHNADASTLPHRRIEDRCVMLTELARHVMVKGADASARTSASALLQFFDVADSGPPLTPMSERLDATGERAQLQRNWGGLRAKLVRIQGGQSEWLRKSEVQRFAELWVEYLSKRKSPVPG
jgi:hypothetical protein